MSRIGTRKIKETQKIVFQSQFLEIRPKNFLIRYARQKNISACISRKLDQKYTTSYLGTQEHTDTNRDRQFIIGVFYQRIGAQICYTVIYTRELSLLIKMSILCILPLIKQKVVTFLGMFCLKNIFDLSIIFLCKLSPKLNQRKVNCHFYCYYVT